LLGFGGRKKIMKALCNKITPPSKDSDSAVLSHGHRICTPIKQNRTEYSRAAVRFRITISLEFFAKGGE
jgi:hypothetical protein